MPRSYHKKDVPVAHADAPELMRDQAHLQSKMIETQYTEHHSKGRKMLKAEFKRGQMHHPAPVMNRESYRAHILSWSLFPNLHNHHAMMKEYGAE